MIRSFKCLESFKNEKINSFDNLAASTPSHIAMEFTDAKKPATSFELENREGYLKEKFKGVVAEVKRKKEMIIQIRKKIGDLKTYIA